MAVKPFLIFSGSAHPVLAQKIANILGIPLGRATTIHLAEIIDLIHEGKSISPKLVLS